MSSQRLVVFLSINFSSTAPTLSLFTRWLMASSPRDAGHCIYIGVVYLVMITASPNLEVHELDELPEQWRRFKLAWLCKELPLHNSWALIRILNAQKKWMRQEDAKNSGDAGYYIYIGVVYLVMIIASPNLEVHELDELLEQWRRFKLAWLCKELLSHNSGALIWILNAQNKKWMRQEDAKNSVDHAAEKVRVEVFIDSFTGKRTLEIAG